MIATGQASSTVTCGACGARNRVVAAADGLPRCGRCSTALPWVVDADDSQLGAVVEASSLPVLVDVWAPWCGPCRMVSPALERLAEELAGRMKLVKINADDNPGVSRRFEVQSIPTLVVLDHGRVVDTQIGAAPEHDLRAWLESTLPARSS